MDELKIKHIAAFRRTVLMMTQPHSAQRYDTVGDWKIDPENEDIQIFISDLGDWRYNLLVGIHELIEAALCKHRGISEEEVTAFDLAHPNAAPDHEEPGDNPDAPYHAEHIFATKIEEMLADELQVDWIEYTFAIDAAK